MDENKIELIKQIKCLDNENETTEMNLEDLTLKELKELENKLSTQGNSRQQDRLKRSFINIQEDKINKPWCGTPIVSKLEEEMKNYFEKKNKKTGSRKQ